MANPSEYGELSVKELVSETTAHGIQNVMSRTRNTFKRFIWFVCVVLMIGNLLVVLYMLCIDYQRHPFNTEVKIEPKTKLDFPTVTLCDLTYLDTTKFPNPQAVQDVFVKNSEFSRMTNINDTNEDYINIANTRLDEAHQISNKSVVGMFQICTWNFQFVPCSQIWTPVFTDMGRCFVFNNNVTDRLSVDASGSRSGLNTIAIINQTGYVTDNLSAAGFKLSFHDPHEDPVISSKGILISPGATSYISVRKKSFKFLPEPYKAYGDEVCVHEDHHILAKLTTNSTHPYNRETCIRACLVKQVVLNCSCKSVVESESVPFPYCTIEKWLQCFRPTLDVLYANHVNTCGCPRMCEFNKYNIQLSTAMFPSLPTIELLKSIHVTSNQQDARSGLLDISIFYEDLLLEEVKQVAKYSYSSMMGTIGGQMGIFLGASFITLAEFMEIVLCFLWVGIQKVHQGMTGESVDKRKSNVVSIQ